MNENEMQAFTNEEFGEIRTVTINNEPYFVGKDVAKALGYKDTSDALKRHVDCDDKLTRCFADSGQNRNMYIVNESGLYSLIMSSKLESAKKFKHWVTSEVLPTIRKTGGYVSNDDLFINTYLPFADETTKMLFSQTLHIVKEQNKIISEQKEKIEAQQTEIIHKEDVIIGLVDDIDLANKRQRITQIVRYGARGNYQERYSLLYSEFEKKYHCNLKVRLENCSAKSKIKNKMEYIDKEMNMIPQLYELACKVFENDVEKLKEEWLNTIKRD